VLVSGRAEKLGNDSGVKEEADSGVKEEAEGVQLYR